MLRKVVFIRKRERRRKTKLASIIWLFRGLRDSKVLYPALCFKVSCQTYVFRHDPTQSRILHICMRNGWFVGALCHQRRPSLLARGNAVSIRSPYLPPPNLVAVSIQLDSGKVQFTIGCPAPISFAPTHHDERPVFCHGHRIQGVGFARRPVLMNRLGQQGIATKATMTAPKVALDSRRRRIQP